MKKNQSESLIILSFAIALVALGLSVYATVNLTGERFSGAVNEEIEAYVARELQKGANANAADNVAPPSTGKPVEVSNDDDAIRGDEDAPVTIVEFSDYQCPYCGRFYTNTLPQLLSEYVDTGKVKMVFRDFPLSFHPNARPAAIAAECAGEQGGDEVYFAYHDKLFDNQAALSDTLYKNLATEMGLNSAEFEKCLQDPAMGEEVDKDFAEGQRYGVSGTPGFFVNGRPVEGAQSFAFFQAIIEEELNK